MHKFTNNLFYKLGELIWKLEKSETQTRFTEQDLIGLGFERELRL